MLKKGRALRGSEPIKCRVQYDYVSLSNPIDKGHWNWVFAIIPHGGICEEGYVKEAWIEVDIESGVDNDECYNLIDPFLHNTDKWIQGFLLDTTDASILLPSSEIVVKYYYKQQ